MNLCDAKHQEVCFEGRECPLCEAREEIADLKREVQSLEQKVENLEASE